MMYKLSSSQSDRINYDNSIRVYIDDIFAALTIDESKAAEAKDYYDVDQMSEYVDDVEEAVARFTDVFNKMKAEKLAS
ncbi:MAG: hypothetical protein ACOYYS_10070 [Chloroflexota bacterium]